MFLRKFGLIVSAAFIGLGASSCFANVCQVSGEPAFKKLDEFKSEWDGAVKLASSTSRMALPMQINRMQEIKREVEKYDWSGCSQTAADLLTKSMDGEIDAFVMFLDPDKSNSRIQIQMSRASELMDSYQDEYYKLLPEKEKKEDDKIFGQLLAQSYFAQFSTQQLMAHMNISHLETDFSKLEVDPEEEVKKYYSFEATEKTQDKIVYLAKAKQPGFKSYALLMKGMESITCETSKASQNINSPRIDNGQLVCGDGSSKASPLLENQ